MDQMASGYTGNTERVQTILDNVDRDIPSKPVGCGSSVKVKQTFIAGTLANHAFVLTQVPFEAEVALTISVV